MSVLCTRAESGGGSHADRTDSRQHSAHLPWKAAPCGKTVLQVFLSSLWYHHVHLECCKKLNRFYGYLCCSVKTLDMRTSDFEVDVLLS
jgi:hypothetical protein